MTAKAEAKSSATSSGIGLGGLLTLLFVTLKLVGEHFHTPVADWSWWWVLSPLWLGVAFFLVVAGVVVALGLLAIWWEKR